jgi:hypothetical protein
MPRYHLLTPTYAPADHASETSRSGDPRDRQERRESALLDRIGEE